MSAVPTQRTSAESFNTEIAPGSVLGYAQENWLLDYWSPGDWGIILRLIEGSSDSYNYRCYCGITPDFIYWMILVSAIGASYALWYSYIRDWKVYPFNHPRLDLALVPVPLTLFFGFMMWACGDNPRYREDKVGEVLDKSVYEMYTGAKVPTPPLMSHFFYRLFFA